MTNPAEKNISPAGQANHENPLTRAADVLRNLLHNDEATFRRTQERIASTPIPIEMVDATISLQEPQSLWKTLSTGVRTMISNSQQIDMATGDIPGLTPEVAQTAFQQSVVRVGVAARTFRDVLSGRRQPDELKTFHWDLDETQVDRLRPIYADTVSDDNQITEGNLAQAAVDKVRHILQQLGY